MSSGSSFGVDDFRMIAASIGMLICFIPPSSFTGTLTLNANVPGCIVAKFTDFPAGAWAYPFSSSQALIAESCLFSCALRMIGSATAPQSRSAMIVEARSTSSAPGVAEPPIHVAMSGSRSRRMTDKILANCSRTSDVASREGIISSTSMDRMRLGEISPRPIKRSLAMGGQQAIRRIGRISGRLRSAGASRPRKLAVCSSAAFTCSVARIR